MLICVSRENGLDAIEVGDLADLVVPDRDCMTISADDINEIDPVRTSVGERIVYMADSDE